MPGTNPSAIARIIKKECGFPTVPWGWKGVNVSKHALPGHVYIEADFDLEAKARRRIAVIADTLRAKGYDVRVAENGTTCSVGKV